MSDSNSFPPTTAVELARGAWVLPSALHFSFSRSSGPGGQAVNKLNTRAQLRVSVTAIRGLDDAAADRLRSLAGRRLTSGDEISLEAETSRSQLDNKLACIEKLRGMVRQALVRPKVRRKKRPSRATIEKRLTSKRRLSEKKQRRTRPSSRLDD